VHAEAEIATCMRQTMQRITPLVLIAAVVIPLVLIGAIVWLITSGRATVTLTVATVVDQKTGSTVSTLPIGPTGATFPYTSAPPAGSMAVTSIAVSGPPGDGAVAGFTVVDQTGKSTAYTQPFGQDGAKFTFTAPNGGAVFTVVGRAGRTFGTIWLDAMLLALGMFVPYLAVIHVYRMRQLQPLIANLPPSDERITMRDNAAALATKMSSKFLLLAIFIAVACATLFGRSAINLAIAILGDQPVAQSDVVQVATSGLAAAYFGYVLILRLKSKRSAG